MNIAFLLLFPACPPACMSVCLNRLPGLMPAFRGIRWKYPVRLQVDSWQGWRCSAFKNTHSVRQQMWDNYFSAAALKLVPKNVMSRPSDTHRGWILCQLECIELKKWGGGWGVQLLKQRINYHLQQIITGEGVWECGTVFWGACVGLHLYFSLWLEIRLSRLYEHDILLCCQLDVNIRRSH